MMMKCLMLVVVAVVTVTTALPIGDNASEKCANPNGTDSAIHSFNCDGSWAIVLQSVEIDDTNGNKVYPIDLANPIVINEMAQNNGGTYNKVTVDVTLAHWGGFLGCSWHNIPTFGLLSNIDGCSIANNCPITPGAAGFKQPLDLGPFGKVIDALGSGIYQLTIKTRDASSSAKEYIGCVNVQGLISAK
jgi:hypothetical protein